MSGAAIPLCAECGMCCNGVLFGDVRLQEQDDPVRLAALGVTLIKKRTRFLLQQPCSCFDGTLCRIYGERPSRCRTFECRLLERVQSGELTTAAALKIIRRTQKQVGTVLRLVRELGNADEHMPLNKRCAALMAEPFDFGGDQPSARRRGRLMAAFNRLGQLLHREFLG